MKLPAPIVLLGERLPPRLSDLPHPPSALYVRGELPRGPAVAIVGTRAPSREGTRFARELARELAARGVAVISGGARGIDTAAHDGALAAHGVTVVVAPAGFAKPYPEENARLFTRVAARGGAYVSLVPDDEGAKRGAFFARNACLVALSHVVVVVEAGLRSGARNAASEARRLGRPLLVVPAAPWMKRGLGCLAELRRGARPCEGVKDVLEALERAGSRAVAVPKVRRVPARRPAPPSPQFPLNLEHQAAPRFACDFEDPAVCARVLDAVRRGARNNDEVVALAGLSAAVVSRVLLTLRLEGVLASGPSGELEVRKTLE